MVTTVTVVTGNPWWCPCGLSPSNVIAVYKPKGASDYNNSLINISNPGIYDALDPGVSYRPTWSSTYGWQCTGTYRYLWGSFVPSTTWTCIIRFNNTVYTTLLFGCYNSNNDAYSIQNISTIGVSYYNGGNLSSVTSDIYSGVAAIAGNRAFLNGLGLPGTIAAGTGNPFITASPFGINLKGTYYGSSGARVQAEAWYDITLSDAQISLISTAMAAL